MLIADEIAAVGASRTGLRQYAKNWRAPPLNGRQSKFKFITKREDTMFERGPNFIVSRLSKAVTRHGVTVKVHISRREKESNWILEVVNDKGTSTVWGDHFPSDEAAFGEFQRVVEEQGMTAFLESAEVIPFRP